MPGKTLPLQNRVTPDGQIVSHNSRGLFMGNRGILHDDRRTLGTSRWKHPHWIICLTEFRDRQRRVMTPGRYTELFFLDEAVTLAAGHRPCAECRRADFNRYMDASAAAFNNRRPKAAELDRQLHQERLGLQRRQRTHRTRLGELPSGVMLRCPQKETDIRLLVAGKLLLWNMDGYIDSGMRQDDHSPDQRVDVLTPPTTVIVLKAGFQPVFHPSARCD